MVQVSKDDGYTTIFATQRMIGKDYDYFRGPFNKALIEVLPEKAQSSRIKATWQITKEFLVNMVAHTPECFLDDATITVRIRQSDGETIVTNTGYVPDSRVERFEKKFNTEYDKTNKVAALTELQSRENFDPIESVNGSECSGLGLGHMRINMEGGAKLDIDKDPQHSIEIDGEAWYPFKITAQALLGKGTVVSNVQHLNPHTRAAQR